MKFTFAYFNTNKVVVALILEQTSYFYIGEKKSKWFKITKREQLFFWLVHHFDCVLIGVLCSRDFRFFFSTETEEFICFLRFFSNANKNQIYLFPSQHVYINKKLSSSCQKIIITKLESVTAVICLIFFFESQLREKFEIFCGVCCEMIKRASSKMPKTLL